jgi:hydrogenase-4 membrane subunit HyfE
MTLPLIFCLIATVIPVFFSRISAAPTWLSLQALALGWITLNGHDPLSLHSLLLGCEVLLVRAVLVPHLLRLALRRQTRISLMPSNLFTWTVAIILIILAFKFGDGARADERALTLGVVAATAVISFLILSTNHEPRAQLVALLFMENALALFESLLPEPWPLPVHLAISAVYILTVAVGSSLLASRGSPSPADAVKELP